jgi:acyl carrier protein
MLHGHAVRVKHDESASPNETDVQARLLGLIAQITESPLSVAEITVNTGLLGRGIGLDSIEVLALLSAIEDEFDLTIADEDLRREHFATIGALVAFVRGCLAR